MNSEIAALRASERAVAETTEEADRLCRDLVGEYACNWVVGEVPDGVWGLLPAGWQSGIGSPVELKPGKPARQQCGDVVVSLGHLKQIAKYSGVLA